MSYKILNQAPKISLSKLAFGNHGNTLYNVIHQLLQQQKSTVKMKEIKISQLAKGVGFQLLSDDFNVELLDSQSSSVSENSQLKRPMEKHSVGSNVNNIKSMDTIKCEVLRIGSYLSIQELPQCRIVKGLALENIVDESMQDEVAFPVPQLNSHAFEGSFFFSDGGFRLLRTLTGEKPKIPSLVILDPVAQKHYIMPARTKFNFDSLVNFVDQFLNGSLVPHQQSEPSRELPREYPKPPLVNMDFREADGIPWVVANGFEEEIFGSSGNGFSGSDDCDKVVLFCNSWCGFCQRMELVVREVYRSLKGLMYLLRRSPPGILYFLSLCLSIYLSISLFIYLSLLPPTFLSHTVADPTPSSPPPFLLFSSLHLCFLSHTSLSFPSSLSLLSHPSMSCLYSPPSFASHPTSLSLLHS